MPQTAVRPPEARPVTAKLVYSVNTGEKPATGSTREGEDVSLLRGMLEEHEVVIRDARAEGGMSLERQGFELVEHPTKMKDFYDTGELRAVYYKEIEDLVKRVSGASRVLVFDHTLRNADEAEAKARRVRAPVMAVHNDYTEWSGPQRVRDLLPDEAEDLLKNRMAVIQVWRPVRRPVIATPLAICDARSIDPPDLIAADRKYEDRVGEIYHVSYNPKHRWYYFPRMQRQEAVIFKCYDSKKDGRARFTAHTAFEDPAAPPDAPARESIEMRTIAFWSPAV